MGELEGLKLNCIDENIPSLSLWQWHYSATCFRLDSYPVQYLGYCTVCNSTNLNRWKHPMAPVKCQLINPRECEKIPNKPHLIISKTISPIKAKKKKKKKTPLASPVLLPLLSPPPPPPPPPSVSASYPNHIRMPTFISALTLLFF